MINKKEENEGISCFESLKSLTFSGIPSGRPKNK
jgi:hypothetical protein